MTNTEIRELFCRSFAYDKLTGDLTWKAGIRKGLDGSTAGTTRPDGRRQIAIKGKTYLAHRVIWIMETGDWPSGMIDHINGNPSDNRISNLRDVTHSTNAQNQRYSQARSKTGLLGVVTHRKKGVYSSTIYVDGARTWLGFHKSPEQAHQAYLLAKRNLHQGCTI